MRERVPQSLSGHILYVGLARDPGMLHRAKYSRFRNESVTPLEEDAHGGSLHLKASASSPASAPNVPIEEVAVGTPNSSMALGTLIPRMANIKLANPSALPSFKNFCLRTKEVPRIKLTECTTIPASPALPDIGLSTCLSTSYSRATRSPQGEPKPPRESFLLSSEDSAILSKLDKDLGHKGESRLEAGVSYTVRYMGCIEVLQSMRSLDFGTRTHVTREAISRLCEAVPGAHGATKRERQPHVECIAVIYSGCDQSVDGRSQIRLPKPPAKFLSPVLGKSNLQFSGMNIKLTISTTSLTLLNVETQQIIANHHMQSISFASGGDPDTTDYVAYVAKDPVNQRACHILECPTGVAQEVINTIGQAFELRFKQYLKNPSAVITSNEREVVNLGGSTWNIQGKEGHEYYNEIPGKEPLAGGLLDARVKIPAEERIHCPLHYEKQYSPTESPKSMNIYENCPEDCKSAESTDAVEQIPSSDAAGPGGVTSVKQQLQNEECYHGKLTRKAAESLLVSDGDFLIRESTSSPGQYVLSGLQGGQAKHLLLVDPEGKVRTKDHVFDSVSHLIRYHMENKLPIISSGSELNLSQPVKKGTGHPQYKK